MHFDFIRSARRLVLAAACALLAVLFLPQPASAATRTLTGADNGATIELTTGDRLVVRLESNVSTGFAWYIQKGSTALVKLDSQDQTVPEKDLPGAPETQVFTFIARGTGKGDLQLHYVRSWEAPKAGDQTFIVHLAIQ